MENVDYIETLIEFLLRIESNWTRRTILWCFYTCNLTDKQSEIVGYTVVTVYELKWKIICHSVFQKLLYPASWHITGVWTNGKSSGNCVVKSVLDKHTVSPHIGTDIREGFQLSKYRLTSVAPESTGKLPTQCLIQEVLPLYNPQQLTVLSWS